VLQLVMAIQSFRGDAANRELFPVKLHMMVDATLVFPTKLTLSDGYYMAERLNSVSETDSSQKCSHTICNA
jgi:hypothetical protein